jgi:Na+-transporting methylmalonyl-CoA/oxaloacetate decarboxylase gamma subunit
MYGMNAGLIIGAIVVGLAVFAFLVLLVRWIFGIGQILDLLTAIEANTAPAKAPAVAEEPAPRPVG